jgi:hypothetical protein
MIFQLEHEIPFANLPNRELRDIRTYPTDHFTLVSAGVALVSLAVVKAINGLTMVVLTMPLVRLGIVA